MTDYVTLLNDKELRVICELIGGKQIREWFKHNAHAFQAMRSGYRPDKIPYDMAINLTIKNKNIKFINGCLNQWIQYRLDNISECQKKITENATTTEDAFIKALSLSAFSNHVKLYFQLTGKEITPEYLSMVEYAVGLTKEEIQEFETIKSKEQEQKKFEENLEKIITIHGSNAKKYRAIISEWQQHPDEFRAAAGLLRKHQSEIPLLMRDEQYVKRDAFISTQPDTYFIGQIIPSHLVCEEATALASLIGCKEIQFVTYDNLGIIDSLSSEDIADLLREELLFGRKILDRCIWEGYVSHELREKYQLSGCSQQEQQANYETQITAMQARHDGELQLLQKQQADYESQMEAMRTNHDKELQELQESFSSCEKKLKQAEDELAETKTHLAALQAELALRGQLADDVHNRVLAKIEEAKSNAAEFFAQQALAYPGLLSVPILNLSLFLEESTIETNDIDYYDTWNDLFFNLTTELQEAGVAQNRAKGLAVLLYAAYVHKIPILLAGPNGEDIAKAFSAVLYARTPAMLRCEGNDTFKAIAACEQSNAEVVLITQPFEREWYQSILRLVSRRDKFYILTHSFKEDLIIEPNGLYNYCLPVLTELFVDSAPNGNYIPSMPSDQYKHFCEKRNGNPYAGLWKQIGITSLAQNNIQTIIWIIHRIFPSSKGTFDYLQILSLAYATEQIQTLIKYIDGLVESEKPSSKVLEQIKRWAGEE